MKIAIYWEQSSWGGVDTQLLALLRSWPSDSDSFVIYYNKGNSGLERIRSEVEALKDVALKELVSWSYNEVHNRMSSSSLPSLVRKLVFFFQPFLCIYMSFKLTRIFTGKNYDVLLSNNGGYPAAWGCLSAILAAKRANIPVRVLLVHHEATKPALFMGWYEQIIDILVGKNVSAIVCPSYATCNALLDRRYINANLVRMRVIYNEIILITESDANELVSDIRNLVDAENQLIIGIVGRIESYKGHEDLIYAISRMTPEDRVNIQLVVIGRGEDGEVNRLKRIADRLNIAQNVHFLGYLAGSSSAIITQLDLLVVATRSFEGFGLTLAEAMLEETPVLATTVGAIPEFLDASVGNLVSPGSPRELALMLTDFVSNRSEWEKKTRAAKQRIHDVSSNMAGEYRRLFLECNDY